MKSEAEIRLRLKSATEKVLELDKEDPENPIGNIYRKKDMLIYLGDIYTLQWVLGEKLRDPRYRW